MSTRAYGTSCKARWRLNEQQHNCRALRVAQHGAESYIVSPKTEHSHLVVHNGAESRSPAPIVGGKCCNTSADNR